MALLHVSVSIITRDKLLYKTFTNKSVMFIDNRLPVVLIGAETCS